MRPNQASRGWVATLASETVPDDVEFSGVLKTRHAQPIVTLLGIVVGIGSFLAFTPVVTQLLAAGYWLATGRQGTYAATYQMLKDYQVPFGMAAAQLGIALLIPISAALLLTIHHVRPAYLFSVRPGLRWRALVVFLGVAAVTLNGVLAVQNLLTGRPFVASPQPGFEGFVVAILITSPLQAAAEEVFFRGYLLQALGSLSSSRWIAIVGSALLFALFHATENVWLFGSIFAFGVLAGVLVVATGGLEASIGAHVINNVCAFLYAGLSGGIAALKATKTVLPLDALGQVVMYAVFTSAALVIARLLRLQARTREPGLGEAAALG